MPSAPSARSADSRASMAVTSAGVAARCHAGPAMLARNVPSLPSSAMPGDGLHPGQRPGRGEAVVDRPALGRGAPVGGVHRRDARFQLERGGDAVQGLQPQPGDVLTWLCRSMNPAVTTRPATSSSARAGRQAVPTCGDPAAGDRDVRHRVQAGSRGR